MKFEIAPEVLAEELKAITGILTKDAALEAQKYVLVDSGQWAVDSFLKLTATNGIMQAETYIKGDWPKNIQMCLPAGKLKELVSLLDGGVVSIEMNDNGHARLSHGKSHFKLGAIAPDLFPRMDFVPDGDALILPGEELRSLIQLTRGFIGEDDSRFVYSGGLFQFRVGVMSLTGTDGIRMAHSMTEYDGPSTTMDILVPHRALVQLRDMIDGDTVHMAVARNMNGQISKLKFRIGNRFLTTNLTTGAFPDVSAALGASVEAKATIEVDKHELYDALKRTLVVNEDKNRIVQFFVDGDGDELALATDGVDAGSDRVPIIEVDRCDGHDTFAVGLNGDHLTQFLNVMKEVSGDPGVVIKYSGLDKFVELNPAKAGNVNFRYLVAPTRPIKN